jgi:hypothetical protein
MDFVLAPPEPGPRGWRRGGEARGTWPDLGASKVGGHLASALTSDNPYDRLFAIQYLQAKPASATAELISHPEDE